MRATIFCLVAALISAPQTLRAQPVPTDEAGFTEHVASLLRKEVMDASVVVKSPLTLTIGELQANLDRVFSFCGRERSKCDAEIESYVKGAAQIHRDRTAPAQRDAVRIVVRGSKYISSAQASVGGQGAEIQPRPFVEGLVALPALDGPRTIRMLGTSDNAQLGLSDSEVYELGLRNLRATLKPLGEVAQPAGFKQIGRIFGDPYEPSRLLLHDAWAPLVKALGGTLIIAAPATDGLIYIGEDTPIAIGALRALVASIVTRAPNSLSDILLRWTETGWEVVR